MVVKLSMLLCFYVMSGVPTTDILRLLKGSTLPINTKHSICDSCGNVIPAWEQFPAISYLVHKGQCKYCKANIPPLLPVLEGLTFSILAGSALLCSFRPVGVLLGFMLYEVLKGVMILRYGAREDKFARELLVSLALNAIPCMLISFIAWVGITVA